jgi:hypothetical protein
MVSMNAPIQAGTNSRVDVRSRRRSSSNDATRCFRCDVLAIAIAAIAVGRGAFSVRAISSSSAAYSDGRDPDASTASSHACSRSMHIRRDARHISGLNQYNAQPSSAISCDSESRRRTCSSSCRSTAF